MKVIPWFKQILKVFVCELVQRNGHILKVLWAKCANQCQVFALLRKPAFFGEAGLEFEVTKVAGLKWFRNSQQNITIACGDYFSFSDKPFDALYDRAALVALPAHVRPEYIQHTKTLLKPDAAQLLLTLEYDQSKANGPPFSVLSEEVESYWPGLRRAGDRADKKNSPPKFREAGISEVVEAVWVTAPRV